MAEKQGIKLSTRGLKSRKMMDLGGGKLKNSLARSFLTKSWGLHRDLPTFAEKSFNKQWREKGENKD